MTGAKPFDIPKREVWEAFKHVKANQGAAGVDGQSIQDFEARLADNLYKLWPTQPLSPGEYAVVQYVEGDGQIQVWDFRVPLNPAKTQ